MSNQQKLVEVYSANGDLEAQIIKGLLESQGITCLLQPHAISSLQNIIVPGMGGVKIMVSENEADEARRLIRTNDDV